MRHSLGLFLLSIGALLQILLMILMVGSAATGIWWPLTKVILDNPVSAIWWVPIGMILTSIAFAIIRFIYDLVIGFPFAFLTTWLMKERY